MSKHYTEESDPCGLKNKKALTELLFLFLYSFIYQHKRDICCFFNHIFY